MKINKVSKIYTQKYKEGVQESPYLTMYQEEREEGEEPETLVFGWKLNLLQSLIGLYF